MSGVETYCWNRSSLVSLLSIIRPYNPLVDRTMDLPQRAFAGQSGRERDFRSNAALLNQSASTSR